MASGYDYESAIRSNAKTQKTKYPNAKKVKERFELANKYCKFLGKRTDIKDTTARKALTFKM